MAAERYQVRIEGFRSAEFDGLAGTIEVMEFQDGDDLFLRKRPGRAHYGDVTLTKEGLYRHPRPAGPRRYPNHR